MIVLQSALKNKKLITALAETLHHEVPCTLASLKQTQPIPIPDEEAVDILKPPAKPSIYRSSFAGRPIAVPGVSRPGVNAVNGHKSENDFSDRKMVEIVNDGSFDDLYKQIDDLVER